MSLDALINRLEPTAFEQFKADPLRFLARRAYAFSTRWRRAHMPNSNTPVRVVCISDTHSHHQELPPLVDGDILIHAGDLTNSGTEQELYSALQWLADQPHPHKIFIAGNHDKALIGTNPERAAILSAFPSLTYLEESSLTLNVRGRTLVVYGSPLTPKHGSWPFQYPRSAPEQAHWSQIPLHTDILVTHGPPAHHCDLGSGCASLLAALWAVRPRLHVFGHIHAARGVEHLAWSSAQAAYERLCAGRGRWWDLFVIILGIWRTALLSTTLVNAASLGGFKDEKRRPPIAVDI
ncbi:Metallo-dependent phosphatase [Heliocybe sulcata]|uniref:Metallo-dependent phosphatase n=1 Tax=Heliocybe sulcata TaxID=5364 RepID=A0A5C3NM54_9AGAM|nr:Metallo-dependent phosphatase [Heliocybe sulcata]